ncbi:MAG: purine-binding chemotaxis protein CheW [Sedimentisphaerales bacterium]|nr:purine-binding chemotaxis protein CheW [Sedimentisphaerales bacterium]MBN2842558.1 purine-binding chemotaxis protein CheW [Sedimentisphaerales bacterium]
MVDHGSSATSLENRNARAKAGLYLTFALGQEEFGLEILKVKEIIGYQDITSVPQTPIEVKGVINLRGQVIPIINLRVRFGMDEKEVTEQTCIIVVEVELDGNNTQVGIIVDNVSEVLDIQEAQIEPSPEFGNQVNTDFILGMGKIGENVKILLDIDQVLAGTQFLR